MHLAEGNLKFFWDIARSSHLPGGLLPNLSKKISSR